MSDLQQLVADELRTSVLPAVRAFAAHLAQSGKKLPFAVVFYGSALRTGSLDGILDFYVVAERLRDWSHGPFAASANGLLPPNVEYHEFAFGGDTMQAKVAILSRRQLRRLCSPRSLDTSVWSRFSQPVALAFARDEAAERIMFETIANAVASAVFWAVRLGPPQATAADYWRDLFQRTYTAELRVEKADRSNSIVDYAPKRYERMFLAACAAADTSLECLENDRFRPSLSSSERRRARAAWDRRRFLAKPLNVARLAKAAFTFQGGADYIVWKIARHSGIKIELTQWQRRHPILASGPILWRLWRRRAVS